MLSVFVRLTVVQISPPPEMRGRVNAVNMLFIGASNELGEFESGLTAQWLGTRPGRHRRRRRNPARRPGVEPAFPRAAAAGSHANGIQNRKTGTRSHRR
jgi:hypothetical protein